MSTGTQYTTVYLVWYCAVAHSSGLSGKEGGIKVQQTNRSSGDNLQTLGSSPHFVSLLLILFSDPIMIVRVQKQGVAK